MKNNTKKMPSGYGMVQTAAMKLKGVCIQAKALYALLASYTGAKDYCFPSIETMANDLGVSLRSLKRYLKELENNNLIKKSKLYPNDKMRTHNKYEVMYIEPRSATHDTSEVTPVALPTGHTWHLGGDTSDPYINNSINNNIFNNKREKEKEINTNKKTKPALPLDFSKLLSLSKPALFEWVNQLWKREADYSIAKTKTFLQKWNSLVGNLEDNIIKSAVKNFLNDEWRKSRPKARTVGVLFKDENSIMEWASTNQSVPTDKQSVPTGPVTISKATNDKPAKITKVNNYAQNEKKSSKENYDKLLSETKISKILQAEWGRVYAEIKQKIATNFFEKFFGDLKPLAYSTNEITLVTVSLQMAEHLRARYTGEIENAYKKITGKKLKVVIWPTDEVYKNVVNA